jgi:SSS family solute:Na+ symporter
MILEPSLVITVLLCLLGAWTLIGILSTRWVRSLGDYFLAGHRMGVPLITITVLAGWQSHYTVMAGGEAGYSYGVIGPIWYAIAVGGAIIIFAFIAYRIKATASPSCVTFPQYLRERFSDIQIRRVNAYDQFVTWSYLPILTLSASSSTLGGALVLQALTGLSFDQALLVAGLFYLVYCIYGGLYSVAMVDVIQFAMISLFLPLVGLYALRGVGGVGLMVEGLRANAPQLLGLTSKIGEWMGTFFLSILGGTLASTFLWQMTFSAKRPKEARFSMILTGFFFMPVALVCGGIGLIGSAIGLEVTPSAASPQTIAFLTPPAFSLLYLLGFIAAAWSTFAASVNNTSSILMMNFVEPFFMHKSSQEKKILASRFIALFFGVISIIIAKYAPGILWLLMFTYALRTPSVIPAIIGTYTKRLNGVGALTATLVGFGATLGLWFYNTLYASLAAFIIPFFISLVFILFKKEVRG